MRLFEIKPAEEFADAHLLGNGSLGASVFGGAPYEKIALNHDCLWSGQEDAKITEGTLKNFKRARELTMSGKIKEATTLINDRMLGYWSEAYMPLGNLHLTFGHETDLRHMWQKERLMDVPFTDYKRELTLDDAVERITYVQGGTRYTREIFVSYPDDALVIRLRAEGGTLSFSMVMDSPLNHEQTVTENAALVTGRAPDRVENYFPVYMPKAAYKPGTNALRFAALAEVTETDGRLHTDGWRCYVTGAAYAVIVVSAKTNYAGFRKPRNNDPQIILEDCRKTVRNAAGKGFETLLINHTEDYGRYFKRVSVDLGDGITEALPTSQRMEKLKFIDDPSVAALVMQYNRYLLLAFSRPGTQAGNLQGIWNPSVNPPWGSNYTTNINVEMNYWGAEVFNLPECHLPMTELVRECAQTGEQAARELYGMPGWVTHHNTDLWRFSALAGQDASWAWWPFGGFWMCTHLWEHYAYTLDGDYLREIYPVLRGAAEFLCAFAVKDENGFYVTAPSTSPENKFFIDGATVKSFANEVNAGNRLSATRADTAEVCKASAMDLAIIRELFGSFKKAAEILNKNEPLLEKTDEILKSLLPFAIGKTGALQEWDEDYEECTPGMGHVSHLYGVYPANVINQETPELFEAARVSLLRRKRHGGGRDGHWPGAWKMCLYARFGDGTQANLIHSMMPNGLGANLLTENVWQMDAVMGWGAGLAEMFLQSQGGVLRLLPALPVSWRDGNIDGLRARGGVTVGLTWKEGKLAEARLRSDKGGEYKAVYAGKTLTVELPEGKTESVYF